jgi:hypothetical protein
VAIHFKKGAKKLPLFFVGICLILGTAITGLSFLLTKTAYQCSYESQLQIMSNSETTSVKKHGWPIYYYQDHTDANGSCVGPGMGEYKPLCAICDGPVPPDAQRVNDLAGFNIPYALTDVIIWSVITLPLVYFVNNAKKK